MGKCTFFHLMRIIKKRAFMFYFNSQEQMAECQNEILEIASNRVSLNVLNKINNSGLDMIACLFSSSNNRILNSVLSTGLPDEV